MGLNWIEEIVGQSYQIKGYLVVYNLDLPMPKTSYRNVRGHSDIDVLAINKTDIVHVECQSWWGPDPGSEEKDFNRLKDRFKEAPIYISNKYPFLDVKKIQNVFVTSGKPKSLNTKGPWQRLATFCSTNGIKLVELNEVIEGLIKNLRERYPKTDRVGKEPSLTAFLLHLIHSGLIIETINVKGIGNEPIDRQHDCIQEKKGNI